MASLTSAKGRFKTGIGAGNAVSAKIHGGDRHVLLLVDVIRSGRWTTFERILVHANANAFRLICDLVPSFGKFKGGTSLLHACLQCGAPVAIIAKLIGMLPDKALQAQDCSGRTPLHVAAACAADPVVLQLLGGADKTSCAIVDRDGRTPLHLACDGECGVPDENDVCQPVSPPDRDGRSYKAVQALLDACPDATLVEDEDEVSPLELAIVTEAPIEVVTLLQKATKQALEERERRRPTKKRRLLDDVI